MEETWTCGDCHTAYPMSVHYCTRYLDDYLALRGGSVESAIHGAVERAIEPLVENALRRLRHDGGFLTGSMWDVDNRWRTREACLFDWCGFAGALGR